MPKLKRKSVEQINSENKKKRNTSETITKDTESVRNTSETITKDTESVWLNAYLIDQGEKTEKKLAARRLYFYSITY